MTSKNESFALSSCIPREFEVRSAEHRALSLARSSLALVLGATASLSLAQTPQTTMAAAGFTGLGVTPNAKLLSWGRMEFAYDRQLPGIVRNPSGHNYVLGFGLLPNVEIAGRLATNSLDANCFAPSGCGARDLSTSGKVGIDLDKEGRFRAAVGIADVGGSVTYFRSAYGVLTFNQGPWEASAGYAKRSGRGINGSRSPLDGAFASAAWQPLPWVRGHLEYTDRNAWAGVRLFAPQAWLPEGWTAYVGANRRITDTNLTEKSWVSAGISIPLYKVPSLPGSSPKEPLPSLRGNQEPLPVYEARTAPPAPTPSAGSAEPARPIPGVSIEDAQLVQLAAALRARGLEDLWVGRTEDRAIAVRANNATYNWNSVDAVGAALAAIAETLGGTATPYRLILTQRQMPLVAVTGQTDCLRQWIQDGTPGCSAPELATPGSTSMDRLHAGAAWVVEGDAPSWKTLRVSLSPVLRTNVGSELGALDYSLGANVGLMLPLWSGASVETRYEVPVSETSDFREIGTFADRRVRSGVERAAFAQTLPLGGGVSAQASIGRFGHFYNGVHGAARWEPGDGKHRISAEAGWFEHTDFGAFEKPGPRHAKPALMQYRYNFTPTRTYLEATGGNFMNNDLGFQLGMRQWFADVAVHVYYKRTRFENAPARQFVGIQLSVPIGPRKDTNPRSLQVTGTPRFTHGVETTVREDRGNAIRSGFGALPPVPSVEATFNSDRAGLLYFDDNARRIRDVAQQSLRQEAFHK